MDHLGTYNYLRQIYKARYKKHFSQALKKMFRAFKHEVVRSSRFLADSYMKLI